ncbi:MAG: hypothetical protein QNJ72_44940 [Pleurocapsa sp. MO_226.B13]|nr:hypothetical protein [Pleurocapsa sp. MO_226.B13]
MTKRPSDEEPYFQKRAELIVGEISASPLIGAARLIGRNAKEQLPALHRLRWDSGNYDGEDLWLNPTEVDFLLQDFRRFRRVGVYEDFIHGLDAGQIQQLWERYNWQNDLEEWLDRIDTLLEQAVENGYWVHISL